MKTQKYKRNVFFSCSPVSLWKLPHVVGNSIVGNLAITFRFKKYLISASFKNNSFPSYVFPSFSFSFFAYVQ